MFRLDLPVVTIPSFLLDMSKKLEISPAREIQYIPAAANPFSFEAMLYNLSLISF